MGWGGNQSGQKKTKGAGASPLLKRSDPPITGNSVEVECQPPREANLMNYFDKLHALCQVCTRNPFHERPLKKKNLVS